MTSVAGNVRDASEMTAFLADALQVFLEDRDVSEIRAHSSGELRLLRRGRWERLQAALEPDIFNALEVFNQSQIDHAPTPKSPSSEAFRTSIVIDLPRAELLWSNITNGAEIWCQKHPPYDVTIEEFVDSGLVSAADAEEIVSHAAQGGGCLVLGPARHYVDRWVIAMAQALGAHRWMTCAKPNVEVPWADSIDLHEADWISACQTHLLRGVEGFFTWGLAPQPFLRLCQSRLGALGIYGIRIASLEQLLELLEANEASCASVATQVCAMGYDGDGAMRLVHHRFGTPLSAQGKNPFPYVALVDDDGYGHRSPGLAVGTEPVTREDAALRTTPSRARVPPDVVLDDPFEGLPPLEPLPPGPPNAWASTSPNDDPGWELGNGNLHGEPSDTNGARGERSASLPAVQDGTEGGASSGFADMMNQVRARPTFQPRPPAPHPLARKLQTDPFGGLTLEPPVGDGRASEDGTVGAAEALPEKKTGSVADDHPESFDL